MTERGVNKALWFIDSEYEKLCVRDRVLNDARSLSAANFLSLDGGVTISPESAEEQCTRLAGLAEEYGADPDIIQSVLESHDPSLKCTSEFKMAKED